MQGIVPDKHQLLERSRRPQNYGRIVLLSVQSTHAHTRIGRCTFSILEMSKPELPSR